LNVFVNFEQLKEDYAEFRTHLFMKEQEILWNLKN